MGFGLQVVLTAGVRPGFDAQPVHAPGMAMSLMLGFRV